MSMSWVRDKVLPWKDFRILLVILIICEQMLGKYLLTEIEQAVNF